MAENPIMRSPRLLRRGDVIRTTLMTGGEVEEVVRDLHVSILLGNGQAVLVPITAPVEIVPQEQLDGELVAQIEEMQSEG